MRRETLNTVNTHNNDKINFIFLETKNNIIKFYFYFLCKKSICGDESKNNNNKRNLFCEEEVNSCKFLYCLPTFFKENNIYILLRYRLLFLFFIVYIIEKIP
jgi:succinate dehydrogenase/fumarate reductase-like Fe-S protein